MLKLIYEGQNLLQLLDLIRTNFVIMDWDNHLPFQEERFTFVLDDETQMSFLRQLPDHASVYLSPTLRQSLNRADYPRLKFQEKLVEETGYPKRLHLAGDLESALDFTGHLLRWVPFCVGYQADDYRREQLELWTSTNPTGFNGQLRPENEQNLILDLSSSEGASHQVVFWDGRAESLHRLVQEDIKIPRYVANVGKRVKQSDYPQLPYIYPVPKTKWLRKRAFQKLWLDLISR